MAGILHRLDDADGVPALTVDDDGHVRLGVNNAAILTDDGGLAVWFQNRTGGASVKGQVLTLGTAPSSVVKTTAGVPNAIGVFLDSGVANGQFARVVIAGVAWVLFADEQTPTRGWWVGSSDAVDGRARAVETLPDNSGAGVTMHNHEMGHCIDTVAAGTDVLARVVLHFN